MGWYLHPVKQKVAQNGGPLYKSHPNLINNMALDKISIPTLIVHHKNDTCDSSAPGFVPQIEKGLINTPNVEVMYVSGGKAVSEGCHPLAAHGFNEIDDEVNGAILNFILSNSK